MSVGLSAALARSAAPRSVESSVTWSGRGTEGIRFCLPASLGMVVPSLAMSKRSPPSWGSEGGAILNVQVYGDLVIGAGERCWTPSWEVV